MKNLASIYREAQVTAKEHADPLSSLTKREEELFELVVSGRPNKDIARYLNISENTVRNHIASIFSKLKVNNRTEAAYLYHQKKLRSTDSERPEDKKHSAKLKESAHPLEKKHGALKLWR